MKTKINKLPLSKLFYNKWLFKIECRMAGASRIARSGTSKVREWCNTGKGLHITTYESAKINKAALLEFVDALEPLMNRPSDMQFRVEGHHFNIFCSDNTVLEEIDDTLKKWIVKISGPSSVDEVEFLLASGNTKILCNKMPINGCKYRVYLKSSTPVNVRHSFLTWQAKFSDEIIILGASWRWFQSQHEYMQSPFVYVSNEKTLSMAGLYLSGHIKRVQEFVLRDNISVA
jgi:hypothetical protein